MITAVYHRGKCQLAVIGHAGFEESGKDIVCAGVSALEYALLAQLDDRLGWSGYTFTDGDIITASDPDEEVRGWFDMAWLGLKLIAEDYPDNISCEEAEETE